jgi:UDP-glucose 4-epimerase
MQNEFLNNKTILVTGATGFIGSKLVNYLENCNVSLVALARKREDFLNTCKSTVYENGDISNDNLWKKLFKKYNFDYIFHLAAMEYQGLNGDLLSDLEINAKSSLIMLDNLKSLPKKPKIVFFSSVNVFGSINTRIVTEESVPKPESYWSNHKLLSQYYFEFFNKIHRVESIILMLPNIYGYSTNLEVTMRMAVNKMIRGAILHKEISLFNNCDIKRNFLYIDDLVKAIIMSLSIKKWNASKYLIGDDNHYSFRDIFNVLKGVDNSIIIIKKSDNLDAFEMRDYGVNVEKFKAETNWKVDCGFHKNIVETYNNLLSTGLD